MEIRQRSTDHTTTRQTGISRHVGEDGRDDGVALLDVSGGIAAHGLGRFAFVQRHRAHEILDGESDALLSSGPRQRRMMFPGNDAASAAAMLWICPAMHCHGAALGSLGGRLDAAHKTDDALGRNLLAHGVVRCVRVCVHTAYRYETRNDCQAT